MTQEGCRGGAQQMAPNGCQGFPKCQLLTLTGSHLTRWRRRSWKAWQSWNWVLLHHYSDLARENSSTKGIQ